MNARRQRSVDEPSSKTDTSGALDEREQPPVEWLLEVVVDPARRQILETLRTGTGGQHIDSLLEAESDRDGRTQAELRAALYHQQLPKLADVGLVEIDWDRKLIYYRPDARIEALLDTITIISSEWDPVERPQPAGRDRTIVARVRRTLDSVRRSR